MKPKLKTVIAAVICGILAGCIVPSNQIKVTPTSWNVKASKDTLIEGFKAHITTNGDYSVEFKRWSGTNSPAVIKASGDAYAVIVNASGEVLGTMTEAAFRAWKLSNGMP